MSIIGSSVIVHKQLGIIMGWSMEKGEEHNLRVHLYDTDENIYKMRLVLPDDCTIVKDPLVLQLANEHDIAAREGYLQSALDEALKTRDENWFLEIRAELIALEEKKVGLGRVVMDMRGKNIGIVVSEPDENRVVKVMQWDINLRKYIEYDKRIDLIQAANADALERWNKQTNHQELGIREIMRENLSDAALQTYDKNWFEKLNQKEMSDGA